MFTMIKLRRKQILYVSTFLQIKDTKDIHHNSRRWDSLTQAIQVSHSRIHTKIHHSSPDMMLQASH
jgi:hypothetical protein